MPPKSSLSEAQRKLIQAGSHAGASVRALARDLGVSRGTVERAIALARKVPGRVRTADEFTGIPETSAPRRNQPIDSWSLEDIRNARDCQMRGDFKRPVRLAEMLRTDDALFTGYRARIAPQLSIDVQLESCGGARGDATCKRAAQSIFSPRGVMAGLNGTLANHGIAIGKIKRVIAEDGTRVDFHIVEWPLEHVKYNHSTEQLETRTREGGAWVPIVHGNGDWVVFSKFKTLPWTQDACLLPSALLWAFHTGGLQSWAGSMNAHGLAKIIGTLADGQPLIADSDGTLTPDARALLNTLQDLVSGAAGAGLAPAGAKVEYLANNSTMWQVFKEGIDNREKAALRIWVGTDATLGSQGGAPGVDISALFGVATTIIQGDFEALEQGWYTGVSQPWAAINEGDSRYAPRARYKLPDPDSSQKSDENAKKRTRLAGAIKEMRDSQLIVDQPVVDRLAAEFGVSPAPVLASADTKAVPIPLAPTDIAKVVRVGAALRSLGLEPFGDERDAMTITELDEANKAKAAVGQAAGEAAAAGPDAGLAPEATRAAALSRFPDVCSIALAAGRGVMTAADGSAVTLLQLSR